MANKFCRIECPTATGNKFRTLSHKTQTVTPSYQCGHHDVKIIQDTNPVHFAAVSFGGDTFVLWFYSIAPFYHLDGTKVHSTL